VICMNEFPREPYTVCMRACICVVNAVPGVSGSRSRLREEADDGDRAIENPGGSATAAMLLRADNVACPVASCFSRSRSIRQLFPTEPRASKSAQWCWKICRSASQLFATLFSSIRVDLPRRFLCLRVLIVEFDSILGTKKQSEKNRSRFPLRFHM